jgi:hypothetical protein
MESTVRSDTPNEIDATTGKRFVNRSNSRTDVRIVRSLDDLLMVYTIRAAVFMAEQDCPFTEEFDGNDHCATHILGFIRGEPAGCLRARFFSDFVKLERLAVRKSFRRSSLAFDLVRVIPVKGWSPFGQGLEQNPCLIGKTSYSRIIAIRKWSSISNRLPIPYH